MTACSKTGCAAAATCAPKLCVPAQGVPIDIHQPMTMIIGLPVCAAHFAELKTELFLTQITRRSFETMARAGKRIAPDFARAFLERIPLNGSEYQTFQRFSYAGPTKAD